MHVSPESGAAARARTYRLHGLTVRSDFELPARSAQSTSAESTSADDLTIRREPSRPVPDEVPSGRALRGSTRVTAARRASGELVVRFRGSCELTFSCDGRQFGCSSDPAVEEQVVADRVVRFGMLAALALAGHLALHASAVELDGRAVAFAGASKSGKSTLAALACGLGARLVTDSVLRIGATGSCFTGPSELRLRPPADVLGQDASVLSRRVALDARVAVTYRQPVEDEVALAAIVVPELDRNAPDLVVEQLHGARAAVGLTPFMRHWFCQDRALDAHHLGELAAVVKHVPVWRCVIPLAPPLDPTYVRQILEIVGLGV